MDRRKFITTASAGALTTIVAGCMDGGGNGGGGNGGGGGNDTATDTPEPTDTEEPTDTPEPTDTEEPTDTPEPTDTQEPTGGDYQQIEGEIRSVPNNLEVTSHEIFESGSEVGVRGTIENVGDTAYEFVETDIQVYDADEEILGTIADDTDEEENFDGLNPGETWQFRAVFPDEQLGSITQYSITVSGDLAEGATGGNATGNGSV